MGVKLKMAVKKKKKKKKKWQPNTELHYNCIELIPLVAFLTMIELCLTLKGVFALILT